MLTVRDFIPQFFIIALFLAVGMLFNSSVQSFAQEDDAEKKNGAVNIAQSIFDEPAEGQGKDLRDVIPGPPRGETVLTRPRPETDAIGIPVQGFLFFPTLAIEQIYDQNIFLTEDGKENDLITTYNPGLKLTSDWNNHMLNFKAEALIGRYAQVNNENYEDLNVSIDGRIDVARETFLFGILDFAKLHENRGSPSDTGSGSPTQYNVTTAAIELFHKINRLSLTFDLGQTFFNFYDSAPLVNQDDRDRTKSAVSLRAAYEIVPKYEAFVRLEGNDVSYDSGPDDIGLDRDSHGYEAVAGVEADFDGIIFGEVLAGYRQQFFGDPNLEDINTLIFGGGLKWNVTNLTTISGDIKNNLHETTSAASGLVSTVYTVAVDHELLRNLLLNVNFDFTYDRYEGGTYQEADKYGAGFNAHYLMNRYFDVNFSYKYKTKNADREGGGDRDYKSHIIALRLNAKI